MIPFPSNRWQDPSHLERELEDVLKHIDDELRQVKLTYSALASATTFTTARIHHLYNVQGVMKERIAQLRALRNAGQKAEGQKP